jgi:hypothetical protein
MKKENPDLKKTAVFVGNNVALIKKAMYYYRSQGYEKALFDSKKTNYIGTSLGNEPDFFTNYEQATESIGFKFIEIPDEILYGHVDIDLGVVQTTTISGKIIYPSGKRNGQLSWAEDYKDAKYYESIEEFFKEYKVKDNDKKRYTFNVIKEDSVTTISKKGDGMPYYIVSMHPNTNRECYATGKGYSGDWSEDKSKAKKFLNFEQFVDEYEIPREDYYHYFCRPIMEEEEEGPQSLIETFFENAGFGKKKESDKVTSQAEGKPQTILQEAQSVVYGDRQADYGSVTENFNNVAKLWSVILKTDVSPRQVALCMVQLKIAREMNKPKRDNLVDICGYAACLEKMENEENQAMQNLFSVMDEVTNELTKYDAKGLSGVESMKKSFEK